MSFLARFRFMGGVAVPEEVEEASDGEPIGEESGELWPKISFIEDSSAFCRFRYTRKLPDAHPPSSLSAIM